MEIWALFPITLDNFADTFIFGGINSWQNCFIQDLQVNNWISKSTICSAPSHCFNWATVQWKKPFFLVAFLGVVWEMPLLKFMLLV